MEGMTSIHANIHAKSINGVEGTFAILCIELRTEQTNPALVRTLEVISEDLNDANLVSRITNWPLNDAFPSKFLVPGKPLDGDITRHRVFRVEVAP